MPTVPRAQQQVDAAPLPGARVTTQAPEGAFGGPDLSAATRAFANDSAEAFQRKNQLAVSDADAQLVRAKTSRLWDPKSGAMNARGRDAVEVAKQAQGQFQQDAAQIEQGLQNDEQKQAFRRRVDLHFADLGNQLGQHVGAQVKQYDADTTEGHLNAIHDAAITSWTDEKSVTQSVNDTRALLSDYWKANGHSDGAGGLDDFARGHIADRVSAIRAGVLSQIVEQGTPQSATQASQYFTAHADEFTGKQRATAQKMVAAAEGEATITRLSDHILGINQPTAQQPKSYADAVAEAEHIQDGGTRKSVLSEIDAHYTRIDRAETRARGDALERLSKTLQQTGGSLNKASADYQLLIGHPEQTHIDAQHERIIRPPKDPGDPDLYMQQLNMAGINEQTRRDFLAQNVLTLPGLNTAQRTHLINLQRQLGGQEAKAAVADPAEAEKLRFERETELLTIGDPSSAHYIPDKAERDAEIGRIKRHFNELQAAHHLPTSPTASQAPANAPGTPAPTGPSGNVVLGATPGFHATADPAGVLGAAHVAALTPVPAEWHERVARDPKYRAYLSLHGYDVAGAVASHAATQAMTVKK